MITNDLNGQTSCEAQVKRGAQAVATDHAQVLRLEPPHILEPLRRQETTSSESRTESPAGVAFFPVDLAERKSYSSRGLNPLPYQLAELPVNLNGREGVALAVRTEVVIQSVPLLL